MTTSFDLDGEVVRMDRITKAYGDLVANDAVTLRLQRGKVHAVVGENGAGKSTLMQVLCGALRADEGEVLLRGERVTFSSTSDAIAAGVGMVYQHFKLVGSMSVGENIVLGDEPQRSSGLIDGQLARRQVDALCERYGLHVTYDMPIRSASVGVKQKVEILRVLRRQPDVVILDEPTAVLSPQEIDDLLSFVRGLAEHGTAVVLITHKLNEVFAVADHITVMQKGKVVGRPDPAEATPADLAAMMVGRSVDTSVKKAPTSRSPKPLWQSSGLAVSDDGGALRLDGVDLEIFGGEILGIAGVDGNGQRELVDVLSGVQTVYGGEVRWRGEPIHEHGVSAAIRRGVSHVPEDRQEVGLIPDWEITDNSVLRHYRSGDFGPPWRLRRSAMRSHAAAILSEFDISSTPEASAASLSGGNQQRLVVGRELSAAPSLVIAEQPTRGVDVGASQFLYAQLVAARDAGAAVVVVSFDLDELLTLADRLIVMYAGRLVQDIPRADADHAAIGELMTGATAGTA